MKYRPEIDGLRALAVVPVILFHAGFQFFSGGFVGVDVFFVISGYLITTILIGDIENKRFSIVDFYERRARRILPALFLVMFICIPFAWMWMLPSQMKDFSQSLVAVSFFASNILFWKESGYFDAAAEEKPLLHTWSLAVEEQYYVLFPIFLLLTWRFGKNKVFWMIVVIAGLSLLLSEWGWRNKETANFYLAPTRAWELFAGSIAAFIVQRRGVEKNNLLALLGLLAIVFSIFAFDKNTPFPSVYALAPVFGTVLIILFADKKTLAAKLLSTKLFVGIGLISYSAYLWHQPLFAFARIRLHEPNHVIFLTLILATLLLALISWRFVEQPFRKNSGLLKQKSQVFGVSISFLVALFTFGLLGHFTSGYSDFNKNRQSLVELDMRIEVNHGINSICEGAFTLSNDCSNSENPEILLWGDSYAMHLYQGIEASNPDLKIRQITSSSCSPIMGISRFDPVSGHGFEWADRCLDVNQSAFDWLEKNKTISFVVLSSPFKWVGNDKTIDSDGNINGASFDYAVKNFLRTIDKIQSLGIGVVVISPTPSSGFNVGDCLLKKYRFDDAIKCNFLAGEKVGGSKFLTAIANTKPVYWLHDDICEGPTCYSELAGIFIYRDGGHLSKEGSAFLGEANDWFSQFKKLALSENENIIAIE